MSSSVNRSTDSPQSSGVQPPEASSVQNQHPATPIGDSTNTSNSAETTADSTETTPSDDQRQQPIPPPSEPKQYRAIGLVKGQYMPSAEQLTRGTLVASDGTLIDAVLLGRVMSLVKNHLNLDQPHLWVVYPRSRQENDNLHVQIVGVWEPETLNRNTSTEPPVSEEGQEQPEQTSPDVSESDGSTMLKDGYFSIRGEVIYQSREQEQVVIKIKQSPRKESDKTKFFKLKLKGALGDKVVGHFWDLHIRLQGDALVIQEANDIGAMPPKKRWGKPPFNKNKRPNNFSNQRHSRKGEQQRPAAVPPKRREPLPKPVKRSEKPGGSSPSGNSS